MATTQIAAARTALATVLSDAGHTVFKYGADPDHAGRTYTVIAGVRAEQDQLAMGDRRVEVVDFELLTFNKYGGRTDTDGTAGEAEVLAIVASIETSLRADPTLGGVVFHTEPSTELELETMADEDGWVFVARTGVEVEVHL